MSEYYTANELAQRWHYSVATIHRRAKAGKIPYVVMLGARRYPKSLIHEMERNGHRG